MKPSKALQIMKSVLNGGNSPFLIGGTGVGKSAVVQQLAEELANGRKIVTDNTNPTAKQFGWIDFRLSLYETVDLGGLPYIDDKDQQKRAFLGNLPTGGEGILFFDEYAQASSSVQAVVGQIIYEKRIGEYVLPEGWKIVCAGNRSTDRAGSNVLPSHVVGRTSLINFEHDTNDWLAWGVENDIHPDILGYINFQPDWLNAFDAKIKTPQPSPRSWTRLSDTLKTNPPMEHKQAICECDIGETASIEFMSFLSLKDEVPNLEDIVLGKDVEVPDSGGICYATICALVTVIKEAPDSKVGSYFTNGVEFVKKFPTPEFGIFFVRSVIGSRPDLKESSTYGQFKVENSDLEV